MRTIAVLLTLSSATLARAEPFPCKADTEKLCADVVPGEGRIVACLWSKQDQLSAECKAAAQMRAERRKNAVEACKPDAETYCKDVAPGHGRVVLCLHKNKAKLSPGCRSVMDAGKKQLDEGIKACKDDARKLCKGVKAGEGRLAVCLSEHVKELTYDCYVWLDDVSN
jgi:hypothetical protein